jgi:undecaprenyl-phosphate 4-deoxy-4-formamido-L-arabinose transferase
VIIPVYNESAGLTLLFRRLYPVLEALHLPFDVIAVDDGSADDSLSVLQAEQNSRHDLRVLALARNFGQHAAVLAGFGTEVRPSGGELVTSTPSPRLTLQDGRALAR